MRDSLLSSRRIPVIRTRRISTASNLNIFETRTRTPFFQDVYADGVRVMLIIGPTGTGKTTNSALGT
jgi:type IV secretory pathway VirB4 component